MTIADVAAYAHPSPHLELMSLRGVQADGSRTVTSALHGLLRDDHRSRAEFFSLTGVRP